jgi:3'-phosphoadenosine 5'-phosphosulfate sulfotransferase (PAPS reductase)/FAD synthetase
MLKNSDAKIVVVDTFHLFPETMDFLETLEDKLQNSRRRSCL